MRASELDSLGRAYLDNWARAQAKVDMMDRWTEQHGWLDEKGNPPPFVNTYFAALNSAQRALGKFADHLKAQSQVDPSMVAVLQGCAKRIA
jgi:hypothetical protein